MGFIGKGTYRMDTHWIIIIEQCSRMDDSPDDPGISNANAWDSRPLFAWDCLREKKSHSLGYCFFVSDGLSDMANIV